MIIKVNYFYDRNKKQTPPLKLPLFSYLLPNIILLQQLLYLTTLLANSKGRDILIHLTSFLPHDCFTQWQEIDIFLKMLIALLTWFALKNE